MARPSHRPGNLPADATSFIGRRRELAELRTKLSSARLVSLVGPGGVGKTRLALRIATDLGRGFRDGAWVVELAEVRDPALVSNAVMAALDLRDQAATEPRALLLSHLQRKELLLVIDNCEHLLEAAGRLVGDVISSAPGVRVIATSREPLTISGENVVPVAPLELPSPRASESIEQLQQNEAVKLFIERAAAASGRFKLTSSNRDAVVNVCRRLDGLPLAIELAAVRTRVLSVEQMRDRLSDRFGLLTAGSRAALPRHQTLRTTIDWSHDLLDPEERALLRRLCAFAGRFLLEDAEAVCGSDDVPASRTLELMSSLVDKSLVIKEDLRGQAVYRLHETMREYAALKLKEAGEVELTGERITNHYWSSCLQAIADARYRLADWLEWMDLEIDNIRELLRQCLISEDFDRGLDLAVSLGWYWITRGTTEGVRWLDNLLEGASTEAPNIAWGYFMRGFLAVLQSDASAARPLLERAVALARQQRDVRALSHSLAMGSVAADMAGDRAGANRLLAEAAMVTQQLDDVDTQVGVLQARVFHGFFAGDMDGVKTAATEGARLSRDSNDLYSLEMMTTNLGFAALLGGDVEASAPLFHEALRIADRIDDRIAQYGLLDGLGCHAAGTGRPRLAAQLIGAADTVREGAGAAVIPWLAPLLLIAAQSAKSALGAARFDTELAAGTRMSRSEAINLALGLPVRAGAAASDGERSAPLGRREADVARLVADGLSNKQIGARLFISERTVDSHVRSILNKLGFNSRAQIAAWMAATDH